MAGSNTVLRTLRLGDNFLTDPGGEAVADLVAANRCLTGLDLRGNQARGRPGGPCVRSSVPTDMQWGCVTSKARKRVVLDVGN